MWAISRDDALVIQATQIAAYLSAARDVSCHDTK